MEEFFSELNLHVTELPIELVADRPVYQGILQELPQINAAGFSKQAMYQELAEKYAEYRALQLAQLAENEIGNEESTSALLTPERLLNYYDGDQSMM